MPYRHFFVCGFTVGIHLMPLSVSAQPECSAKLVLGNCEFFDKHTDQKFIKIGDHVLPNPRYKHLEQAHLLSVPFGTYGGFTDPPYVPENQEELVSAQLDLQKLILYDPAVMGSTRFKLALSNPLILGQLASIEGEGTASNLNPFPTTLPWPPDAENGRLQSVALEQIKKDYLDKLPPQTRKEFQRQLKVYSDLQKSSLPTLDSLPPFKPESVQQYESIETRFKVLDPTNQARIKQIFENTKALLLDEIAKGRTQDKLPSEQRILYEKVASVKLQLYRENTQCAGEALNAFYHPGTNHITLCPAFYGVPDASLVYVLGHELAHSIDPCTSHRTGFKILRMPQAAEVEQLLKKHPKRIAPEIRETLLTFEKLDGYVGSTLFADKESPTDAEKVQFWKELGVIEVTHEPYPAKLIPEPVAMKCLTDKLKLKKPSVSEAIEYVNTQRRLKMDRLDADEATVTREFDKAVMSARMNPWCASSPDRKSQYDEAAADIWGTKVLGRYLETHPLKSEADRFAAFIFQADAVCKESVAGNIPTNMGAHPPDRDRLEKILLTDVRIQRALGCKGDPKNHCLNTVGTRPNKKASGTSIDSGANR